MSTTRPDVVVCDDRELLMEAMVELLRQQPEIGAVQGDAQPHGALALLLRGADVLLLWAGHTGEALTAEIVRSAALVAPDTRVLLVETGAAHDEVVRTLIDTSVSVIDGDRSADGLVAAIVQVASGQVVLPAELATSALRLVSGAPARQEKNGLAAVLTHRELEILELLAAGVERSAIARRLALSPHTVRTHIGNIMSKLDVHSQVELAAIARRSRPVVDVTTLSG